MTEWTQESPNSTTWTLEPARAATSLLWDSGWDWDSGVSWDQTEWTFEPPLVANEIEIYDVGIPYDVSGVYYDGTNVQVWFPEGPYQASE